MKHDTPNALPMRRSAVEPLPTHQPALRLVAPLFDVTPAQGESPIEATLPACPYDAVSWLTQLSPDESIPNLEALLVQALQQWPLHTAVLASIGDAALMHNHYALALKAYQRWCRLQPSQSRAFFSCALAHEALHTWDEAKAHYQQALALDASYLAAYHNLGTLYMHTGQSQYAITLFRGLKQRYPKYAMATLGLAMAYDTAGQGKVAVRRYRQFLSLCPTSLQVPQVLARLAELKAQHKLTLQRVLKG